MSAVLARLSTGLWHTTHPERYASILRTGAILPEPAISDDLRWKAANGPRGCPFVRAIGGVSLFDFRGFDPETYDSEFVLSTWTTFVPYIEEWGCSAWIEVDPVLPGIIGADDLLERWRNSGELSSMHHAAD